MNRDNILIDIDESVSKIIENVYLKDKIEKIVYYALEEENIDEVNVSVSINAVSGSEIKKINKEYRNVDSITDVLSFPVFTKQELEQIINSKEEKKLPSIELGDIILCIDVIKQHAIEYNTGLYRETLYMITHAIFHLLGYDHIEESDKNIMRTKEEKILSKIGEI